MRIVVFTGAGFSKESGIDTFRKGGRWDEYDVREVAYADRWYSGDDAHRQTMLDFYNARRAEVLKSEPNTAHKLIASLEPEHEVVVITQNIDDLHERGGSSKVIHLHGEIMKARSDFVPTMHDEAPELVECRGDIKLGDRAPDGRQLRPHVVWFGEGLPELTNASFEALFEPPMALIVSGTTLEVSPANQLALCTRARFIYIVDPAPPDFLGMRPPLQPYQQLKVIQAGASEGIQIAIDDLMQKDLT